MENEPQSILEEPSVKLGRPQWDRILSDLISCTYAVRPELMTERDREIQVVLIALHEATQGKSDLTELSQICLRHSDGETKKLIEISRECRR